MPKVIKERQKRFLRSLGHSLRPVLMVGHAGVTAAVVREAEVALDAHELIKARLRVGEREDREAAIAALIEATGATLVQRIGHVALLYRPHPERPRIILPSG
jgi:RNA-binding protein